MKRLGLIGSASAADLEIYWRTIRCEAEKMLGPGDLPEMVVYSAATRALRQALRENDWGSLVSGLVTAGTMLAGLGADGVVICGSALNPAAAEVQSRLQIPVVDLCGSVTAKLRSLKHRRIAVLGARTSREVAMWEKNADGVTVIMPEVSDAEWLLGRADASVGGHAPTVEWKIETNRIVTSLRRSGAQALVLADPALSRWIKPGDSVLYPIDASEIHAWMAAIWTLQSESRPAPPCIALG